MTVPKFPAAASALLLIAAPAAAQVPLCAWNGTGLKCPSSPLPAFDGGATFGAFDPLGQMQRARERSLADAQARAELDRRLAEDRIRQAEASDALRRRTDALVGSGQCAAAEAIARGASDAEVLKTVQTACAGRLQ